METITVFEAICDGVWCLSDEQIDAIKQFALTADFGDMDFDSFVASVKPATGVADDDAVSFLRGHLRDTWERREQKALGDKLRASLASYVAKRQRS